MSAAEITARRIYSSYHLGALPEDVKKHLMILFLSEGKAKSDMPEGMVGEDFPPMLSAEELRARISEAETDILAGKTNSIEEFNANMEMKYPWLCE